MSVREGNKRRGGKRALIKQTPLIPAVPKERFRHYFAKMPASLSISHNIYRHTHIHNMYVLTEVKLLPASTKCLTSNAGKRKIYSTSF